LKIVLKIIHMYLIFPTIPVKFQEITFFPNNYCTHIPFQLPIKI